MSSKPQQTIKFSITIDTTRAMGLNKATKLKKKTTDYCLADCSQATGERLASSVALVCAAGVSAAGGAPQGWKGAQKWIGGTDVEAVGDGMGSISKSRPLR